MGDELVVHAPCSQTHRPGKMRPIPGQLTQSCLPWNHGMLRFGRYAYLQSERTKTLIRSNQSSSGSDGGGEVYGQGEDGLMGRGWVVGAQFVNGI